MLMNSMSPSKKRKFGARVAEIETLAMSAENVGGNSDMLAVDVM